MYESFTDRARKVIQLADSEAVSFNHEYIGTEHVLLGLIKEGSGVAANALKFLGIDLQKSRLEVERLLQSGPCIVPKDELPLTPRARKVIEYSMEEARHLNHNYVGTEHILLGLLREQEGVAAQVLMNLGLKLEEVREEVLNLLGHGLESESSRQPEPTLNNTSRSGTTRILDAAANRATEGLRVVEDFARFSLDDAHLTRLTKNLRHDLATTCAGLSLPDRHASRETQQDVGTTITNSHQPLASLRREPRAHQTIAPQPRRIQQNRFPPALLPIRIPTLPPLHPRTNPSNHPRFPLASSRQPALRPPHRARFPRTISKTGPTNPLCWRVDDPTPREGAL